MASAESLADTQEREARGGGVKGVLRCSGGAGDTWRWVMQAERV